MAKIKGICRNEECDHCDEIMEAEKSNFVCEYCQKPLFPINNNTGGGGGGGNKRKLIGIIAAAILLIGGGTTALLLRGCDDKKVADPAPQVQVKEDLDSSTVKVDTLEEPQPQPVKVEEEQPVKPKNPPTSGTKPKAGYGTYNMGYGIYKGELNAAGLPHGHGTITYKQSHKIVSSADYVANPGDTYEGDFRDGRISGGIGYWRHDGDITGIQP